MSPRPADPAVRDALVDAAARLLVEHGSHALTSRRVAEMAGTSTMAVYTHFDGMDNLRTAVAEEGFARLRQHLDRVRDSDDPAADVACLGAAYLANAFDNPRLYQLMFSDAPHRGAPGADTFARLVTSVRRAVEARRFSGDPDAIATQLWASVHGVTSLCLLGAFRTQDAVDILSDLAATLFVGFGDDRAAARRSVRAAMDGLRG